jgi:hypothetical protein
MMPTSLCQSVSLAALTVLLGLPAGYALAFVALAFAPDYVPGTWPGWLVVSVGAALTCVVTWLILTWQRRWRLEGRRGLVVAVLLAGLLLVVLPCELREPVWIFEAGPQRGQIVNTFRADCWGATQPAFELHASDRPNDPDTRWPWRAAADLTGLHRGQAYQLDLTFTQPENSVFDPASGAPWKDSDGVCVELLAQRAETKTSLYRFRLAPQTLTGHRRWFPVTIRIPPGAERLVMEVRLGPPGSNNAYDRLWVRSHFVTPILFGLGRAEVASASRLLVAGWLAWALSRLVQTLDVVLAYTRCGAAFVWAASICRRTGWRYWLPVAAAGTILVAYRPVVAADYAKLDDYWFLWMSKTDPQRISTHDRERGRFLAAPLHGWAFGKAANIAELRRVRAVTVLGLTALAGGLTALLCSRGWPPMLAAALAVSACATPAAFSTAAMATSVHRPPAALCALLASRAAVRAADARSRRRAVAWLVIAVLVLFAALSFQQSWAMFYVPFCFLTLFRADDESGAPRPMRLLAAHALPFVVALGLSALTVGHSDDLRVRRTVTRAPYDKAAWFVREPLLNAACLAQMTPDRKIGYFTAAIVLVGGLSFLARRRVAAALCLTAGVVLLPVSYVPNLVTAENWASYRSIGPLSALLILVLGWAFWGIARLVFQRPHLMVAPPAVALAGWLCLMGRYNVREYIVEPQVLERDCFRYQILQGAAEEVTVVHIIQPPWQCWPVQMYRYDDFGVPSSFVDWCPEAMFRLVAAELPPTLAARLQGLPVTWGPAPHDDETARALVIDMRLLKTWKYQNHGDGITADAELRHAQEAARQPGD